MLWCVISSYTCTSIIVNASCCALECKIFVAADGSSDETDVPIRKVFADEALVKKYKLGNLNSVNWCRMMVQMAHHFHAYFEV